MYLDTVYFGELIRWDIVRQCNKIGYISVLYEHMVSFGNVLR